MPSFEKHSQSTSEPFDARLGGMPKEPVLQIQSASAQADAGHLDGTSFNSSGQLSTVAGSRPADLEGDTLFTFYPSAGHPSEEHRPNLVDAVIEQLRHAKLKRQRPH